MKTIPTSYYLYGAAALIVVGLIVFVAGEKAVPSSYNDFASCLTEEGVTFYGAWWCPHCENQKKLFGSAFDNLNSVECALPNKQMTQECQDAGIEGYPTWEFADGSRASGEQSFEDLAARTGCEVPVEDTEE